MLDNNQPASCGRPNFGAGPGMALCTLSPDEQGIIFSQLCNTLDPGVAVAFSSTSSELRALTQAPRQQLRVDHDAAAALGRKLGLRTCKELREAKMLRDWRHRRLAAADLATLGTLVSVLPSLERLSLYEPAAGPDGVQRLAVGLGAGALPAVTFLGLSSTHLGDAGASASQQPAPMACSNWLWGWARARCRP